MAACVLSRASFLPRISFILILCNCLTSFDLFCLSPSLTESVRQLYDFSKDFSVMYFMDVESFRTCLYHSNVGFLCKLAMRTVLVGLDSLDKDVCLIKLSANPKFMLILSQYTINFHRILNCSNVCPFERNYTDW